MSGIYYLSSLRRRGHFSRPQITHTHHYTAIFLC